MQRLLHDVNTAADLVSLSRRQFYREVHAGRITIVKAGKKSLVPQSSLDKYVEERIEEAQASRAA